MMTRFSFPSPLWGEEGARAPRGKVRGPRSQEYDTHLFPLALTLSPLGRGKEAPS